MLQYGNIFAKELGNCIKMCMCLMCGMQDNKFKQPKFIENSAEKSIYYQLTSMIDEGKFNEAENTMSECLNPTDLNDYYIMLCVYDYMNDFEDEFIEQNNFSREEIQEGVGEANEIAITRVLWDMADSASTNGSVTESHDNVALGVYRVWGYTVKSKAKTLSEFMQYVYTQLSATDYRNIGSILAKQNITASKLKTGSSSATTCKIVNTASPTFSWTLASGSEACLDSYSIRIYDTSRNIKYSISIGTGTSSYKFASSTWSNIVKTCSDGFYWCIVSNQYTTPATGPYYSQFIKCNYK